MNDAILWVEKYRPNTIEECILPQSLKGAFLTIVERGELPNLLLLGKSGIGKTTVAKALARELNYEYIFINASLEGNIDTLRGKISSFSSTFSMDGKRKLVILDEADAITPATQAALRGFIEEFAGSTAFILTANFGNKIIKPLHSRFTTHVFQIPKTEKLDILKSVDKLVRSILKSENVTCSDDILVETIQRNFPDIRKILNTLQGSISSNNTIDGNKALVDVDKELVALVSLIRQKEYLKARHWLTEHPEIEPSSIVLYFYDKLEKIVPPVSFFEAVTYLAEAESNLPFVANPQITLSHLFGSLMTISISKDK